MAYANPIGQQYQQPETLKQENPNKMQEMMLLASAMQPQQYQQQQQGGGNSGGGGMGGMSSMLDKFTGGGGAAGGAAGGISAGPVASGAGGSISSGSVMPNAFTEALQGGISQGGVSGGSAAGGSAAGGSSSAAGGSGIGGAGWAALLAAIIAGNENQAIDKGARDSGSSYWWDLAHGEVLEQDITDRWGPKAFGSNKYGFGGDALLASQLAQLEFGQGWDTLRNESTLARLLGRGPDDDDKHWTEY